MIAQMDVPDLPYRVLERPAGFPMPHECDKKALALDLAEMWTYNFPPWGEGGRCLSNV